MVRLEACKVNRILDSLFPAGCNVAQVAWEARVPGRLAWIGPPWESGLSVPIREIRGCRFLSVAPAPSGASA
jgi:hypothetical protein